MNNKIKIIICGCIILAVTAIGVYAKNRAKNNEENVANTENISNTTVIENKVEENDVEENVVTENTVTENVVEEDTNKTVENSIVQDNLISSPDKNVYESQSNIGSTNSKEEAINLVKEYWGEDDTVTFSCDSVTSNGEYIIAVASKNTATVQGYFRVNIENKTVEVDY